MDFFKAFKKVKDDEKVAEKDKLVNKNINDIKDADNNEIVEVIVAGVKDKHRLDYCLGEIEGCIKDGVINLEELEIAVKRINDHQNFKDIELHITRKPDFTLFSKPFYILPWNKKKKIILMMVEESKWISGGVFGGINNNHFYGKTNISIKNKLPGLTMLKADLKVESNKDIFHKNKKNTVAISNDNDDKQWKTNNNNNNNENNEEQTTGLNGVISSIDNSVSSSSSSLNKRAGNRIYVDLSIPELKMSKKRNNKRHDLNLHIDVVNLDVSKKKTTKDVRDRPVDSDDKDGKWTTFKNMEGKVGSCVSHDEFSVNIYSTRYMKKTRPFTGTQGTFVSGYCSNQRSKGSIKTTTLLRCSSDKKYKVLGLSSELCCENDKGKMEKNASFALGAEIGCFSRKETQTDDKPTADSHKFTPYSKVELSSAIHLPIHNKLVAHFSAATGIVTNLKNISNPEIILKNNEDVPEVVMFKLGQRSLPGFSDVKTSFYGSVRASLTVPVFDVFAKITNDITRRQGKTETCSLEKVFRYLSENIEILPFVQCTKMSPTEHHVKPMLYGGVSAIIKDTVSANILFGAEKKFHVGFNINF